MTSKLVAACSVQCSRQFPAGHPHIPPVSQALLFNCNPSTLSIVHMHLPASYHNSLQPRAFQFACLVSVAFHIFLPDLYICVLQNTIHTCHPGHVIDDVHVHERRHGRCCVPQIRPPEILELSCLRHILHCTHARQHPPPSRHKQ